MISSVGSVLPSSDAASNARGAVAKIESLNKQASTLRQQLVRAQKPGSDVQPQPTPETISRELLSVQSQIERLVLEAQLSKLSATSGTGSSTGSATGAAQRGSHNSADIGAANGTSDGASGRTSNGASSSADSSVVTGTRSSGEAQKPGHGKTGAAKSQLPSHLDSYGVHKSTGAYVDVQA